MSAKLDSTKVFSNVIDHAERLEIESFLYTEARLADESRYAEWEALLADDMRYWVPIHADADPDRDVSIINDNRSRLATRIRQLTTGTRLSQSPRSTMRRTLANIEIVGAASTDYRVYANFVVYEYQTQSIEGLVLWPGRVEYGIRRADAGLKLYSKKVMLATAAGPITSLAFLI